MRMDTQTLAGMSLSALQDHYEKVKGDYLEKSGRDVRTQAYLSQVNTWIQKRQNETEVTE